MHKTNTNSAKRIFLRSKKNYRGGIGPHTQELNTDKNYPAVYGIDNKTVLYPISKYGEPSGFFDPPVNSNGPNGNGPINGPYLGMGGKRRKTKRSTKKRRSMKKRTTKKRMHKRRITKRRSSRKFRGGGGQSPLLPQTIVNAGRGLMQTVYETANGFSGHTNSDSLNPMPYVQPIDDNIRYLRTDFPNVAQNYNNADNYVNSTF